MTASAEGRAEGPDYEYRGLEWFDCVLPTTLESWVGGADAIAAYVKGRDWQWNGRRAYFLTDIHADADAFFLSLVASGGVAKTGPADADFELTPQGREALFVIGGDCFDKGPETLRLLEAIHQLYLKGADIKLLAGNHDVRTYLGIYYAESKDPLFDHLFVRMGKKSVPFLKELIAAAADDEGLTAEPEPAAILFPDESWYELFPAVAAAWIPEEKLHKEVSRIREKRLEFEECANRIGLSMPQVYQAVKRFRAMFLEPEGRYFWFFERMVLAHRIGSYLFLHAGVDDKIAAMLRDHGVERLNSQFRRMLNKDPFALYHGELGNTFRTKYRSTDFAFTRAGVEALHDAGIHAIVHGHKKLREGQHLAIREGILNFECDASVDRNTRVAQNLDGPGGAVLVFAETGKVYGISTDYPRIKSFFPGS